MMIIDLAQIAHPVAHNNIVDTTAHVVVEKDADLSFLQKERLHTGFGQDISSAKNVDEALELAGMNWRVEPKPMFYMDKNGLFREIPNQFQNVRVEDGKPLGSVSGRYKICQNQDAFSFTDELLGSGIQFDRGGSFRGGRSVWLSARMPEDRIILGDPVRQNLVFVNTHDGTGSVKIMIAPMRIVCSNAINLITRTATRKWACVHAGEIAAKMEEAKQTLLRAEAYMDALEKTCEELQKIDLHESEISDLIEKLFPFPKDPSDLQVRNVNEHRSNLRRVYFEKEDLKDFGHTAYRFVNAVSDYVTHAAPQRETRSYNEKLYEKTIAGHSLIDQAQRLFAVA